MRLVRCALVHQRDLAAMLITLSSLSKAYGDHQVLRDVTFTMHPGDKWGLVGANGVGKSTLVKIITGEVEPDAGSVQVSAGVEVGYLPQMLAAATGGPSDLEHWLRAGERAFVLKRAFNNRLGIRRGHDRLPERLLRPMANGSGGRVPRMDILLREFYRERDWDWDTGQPSRESLLSLGLEDVAGDLWG